MSEVDMNVVQRHFDEISESLTQVPANVTETILVNLISAFAAAVATQQGIDPSALIRLMSKNAIIDMERRLGLAGVSLRRPN